MHKSVAQLLMDFPGLEKVGINACSNHLSAVVLIHIIPVAEVDE